MPVAIQVGPPVITINQGNTFVVSRYNGEIETYSELGVFAQDTRFVSYYSFTLNRAPWKLLTSTPITYYSARWHFTNPTVDLESGTLAQDQVSLTLGRTVGEGVHEDYDINNFAMQAVEFHLGIVVRSDFADIFDVHSGKLSERGNMETHWDADRLELTTVYEHVDFHRELIFRMLNCPEAPRFANGRLTFDIRLKPGESWHTCCFIIPVYNSQAHEPIYGCNQVRGADTAPDQLLQQWKAKATGCRSSNVDVERAFSQSVEDMGALRLHQEGFTEDVWLPAAGVPWFVTVFGRDSLIVSLQNMSVYYPFAQGALQKLGELQATEMDDWRDAEPGKILHEIRFGELAHFHRIPHTPYYGTADATVLYLIVLAEAYAWHGERSLIEKYLPIAERCLEWIDRYGDLDGDGFQEYRSRSTLGYENVGWKDSGDSVVYPDGSQVLQPKGLCELQGYVYDAKCRMASVFDAIGDNKRGEQLRAEAADLKRRFNEVFWMPEENFLAYGLDPDKKLIRTIASNPGHCLWSGIVDEDKAEAVVRRLLQPDMFSGWGIRTLSSQNPAYNPFSYQLGSVWPHDNSIIAAGMKRYGFANEANIVAKAILDATRDFAAYRLPELYAGLPRVEGSFPVQYQGANIPQAWAAGSIFQLIAAMLGLRADAPNGCLYVDPMLPDWLPDIRLQNLMVAGTRLDLSFRRNGTETDFQVTRMDGRIKVMLDPARKVQPPAVDDEERFYF
ncbi:MAG: amylo-alpha-1,6-glucosidase [Dehalococcoidia bacterium]